MLFYQFTGKLKEAPQVSDPMDARQARRAKAAMIKVKTDQYAESRKDDAFPFVSGISEDEVVPARTGSRYKPSVCEKSISLLRQNKNRATGVLR